MTTAPFATGLLSYFYHRHRSTANSVFMAESHSHFSIYLSELIFLIQTIFTSFLYDVALFMWLDVVDGHSGGCDSSKETKKNITTITKNNNSSRIGETPGEQAKNVQKKKIRTLFSR